MRTQESPVDLQDLFSEGEEESSACLDSEHSQASARSDSMSGAGIGLLGGLNPRAFHVLGIEHNEVISSRDIHES
jgi:hypothetical protein